MLDADRLQKTQDLGILGPYRHEDGGNLALRILPCLLL
jgi:hypothetical protein